MKAEIEFYGRAWREQLSCFLNEVKSEIMIVCPYIREAEANFVTNELSQKAQVLTLTSLQVDSIVTGALEINGIRALANFSPNSRAINLPKLHAKVLVADAARAIVTSANLTSSGIDNNYEYGISVRGTRPVAKILSDLDMYGSIGAPISNFENLQKLAESAKKERQESENKTAHKCIALKQAINSLEQECLSMQVGQKSKTAIFTDAIRYVLASSGAAKTKKLKA